MKTKKGLFKITSNATIAKHEHLSEVDFVRAYFNHKNWIYQPACFRMNGTLYSPDFYDGERNCFIEVAGTRQAYHGNKKKYELFKNSFPLINFEIRKRDGALLDESDCIEWAIGSSLICELMCSMCGIEPVKIRKHQLCMACYHKNRKTKD